MMILAIKMQCPKVLYMEFYAHTGFKVMCASYRGNNASVGSQGSQKGTPNTSSIVLSASLSFNHFYSSLL